MLIDIIFFLSALSETFCVVCCYAPIWQPSLGLVNCRGSSPVWPSTIRTDTWTAGEAAWWVWATAEGLTNTEGFLLHAQEMAGFERVAPCSVWWSHKEWQTVKTRKVNKCGSKKSKRKKKESESRKGEKRCQTVLRESADGGRIVQPRTEPETFDRDQMVLSSYKKQMRKHFL